MDPPAADTRLEVFTGSPVFRASSHQAGNEVPGAGALVLAKLDALMARSTGSADIRVGLIDGPVATAHPDLAGASLQVVGGGFEAACAVPGSGACAHGTFIAGILAARRGSRAPAICPGCTLLVRPIFREGADDGRSPVATPDELARAIVECVTAGARVINLSAATGEPSMRDEHGLHESLDYAARRGVLVVAAAGNQAMLGSSAITRHPWVIPVVACDRRGRPMGESNLGASIGRRGLGAPGESIESLGARGTPRIGGGTSSAAAFVTGTVALLLSLFPRADPTTLKRAVIGGAGRTSVNPPLLDAEAALQAMARGVRV